MGTTFNIEIPEGYEIDKKLSTSKKIIFKKKEKSHFSKNWEEFCKNNVITYDEFCFDTVGDAIRAGDQNTKRSPNNDTAVFPSKFVNPMRALMQLITIREKEYTKGWEAELEEKPKVNFAISNWLNKVTITSATIHHVLSFPTRELCDEFYNNWKNLIEIAKPLL